MFQLSGFYYRGLGFRFYRVYRVLGFTRFEA